MPHSQRDFDWGIPKITSVFGDLLKKKHKTQHVVAHMAKIYYNERIRKQDKQRSWLMGRVWRKPNTLSKSSSGGTVMRLIPPAMSCDSV